MADTVIDHPGVDFARARRRGTGPAVFQHRLVRVGAAIVIFLGLLALAAPGLTRLHVLHEPIQQDQKGLDADGMPLPPGGGYLLGTDNLGRDVLSRVIYGARVSLTIGTAAMLLAVFLGLAVGLLAGFYGGKLDLGLMRFTEMNMTIPAILLAIAFAGLMDGRQIHPYPAAWQWHFLDLQLKRGMVSLFLIIGFVCWPGMVRVIRAQVLALKERDFVQAARALGASNARVIWRHILPNLLPTVIVLAADEHGEHHPAGGGSGLPRHRRAAAGTDLGHDDRRWPALLRLRADDRHRTGRGHCADGARLQSDRAGFAGSAESEPKAMKRILPFRVAMGCPGGGDARQRTGRRHAQTRRHSAPGEPERNPFARPGDCL